MPILNNQRHELFAQELAKGKSADEAYVLAGFKANRGNASVLKAKQNISKRVEEIQARAAADVGLSKKWVIEKLISNVERAMQAEEIKDANGGTGEYKYEGSVANKALELLGKEIGMFKEKVEHSGDMVVMWQSAKS